MGKVEDSIIRAQQENPIWTQFINEGGIPDVVTRADELGINPCLLIFLVQLGSTVLGLLKTTLKTLVILLGTQLTFLEAIVKILDAQLAILQILIALPEKALAIFDLPAQILGELIELGQSCPEVQRILAGMTDFFTNPLKLQVTKFRQQIDDLVRSIEDVKTRLNNLLDLRKFLNNVIVAIDSVSVAGVS